jgi:predicted TIM-barrel fold metal-dependent hydrolase
MEPTMISADDHLDLQYLPPDLWVERLPRALRGRAPHVEDRGEEGEFWVCDGETWTERRGERWAARPNRTRIALDRVGAADPTRPVTTEKRLADMDRDGVQASVIFPPIVPMQVGEDELRNATVRAYNDWAAEFRATAPDRLQPIAMLSPLDPVAAAEEVYRAARLGFKQVNFLVNDVTLEMNLEPWDSFWNAAEETGMIVSYHVGGSLQIGSRRDRGRNAPGERKPAFDMGLGNGATSFFDPFVDLFALGTLDRHPNLKFVLGESGTGWIPFVVQEMDYRYHRVLETRTVPLHAPPSEVFKRQVWATYQSDAVGLHLVEFFGDGHMMWASDYPHPDSTWPHSQQVIARETAHLSPEAKRKILHDNAAALYGLGVPVG